MTTLSIKSSSAYETAFELAHESLRKLVTSFNTHTIDIVTYSNNKIMLGQEIGLEEEWIFARVVYTVEHVYDISQCPEFPYHDL